jgi:YggT family protein
VFALIAAAITVLQLLLIGRVVVSWVRVLAGPGMSSPTFVRVETALIRVTEPILAPIRRVIPPLRLGSMGLDLSIPIVFVALALLSALLGV